MQDAVTEALADIRVEPVEQLRRATGPVADHTHASWTEVLARLEAVGRAVVPRSCPSQSGGEVLTYPLQSTFGRLLDAAARFLESPCQENAERTAQEARTVKALTVVPALRHDRVGTPPTDGTDEELLNHRISAEGNGFLALSVAELTAAMGPIGRKRALMPAPLPSDPEAYVVLWNSISAPGFVLSGVNAAHTDREHGAALLQSQLDTAARALVPGEPFREWH